MLIKHGAAIKRERNAQLSRLLSELAATELQHKQLPHHDLETKLRTLRSQITDLLLYKAKAALQVCCRMSYESGDKCGRLLAKSVKAIKTSSYIPQITLSDGKKAALPKQIAQGFETFFSDLYNLPSSPISQADIDKYVSDAQIPPLSVETQNLLDEPITLKELQVALNSMKIGKAPGPEGFTVQYYKILLPVLGPRLVAFFNTLGVSSHFLSETLKAHISLIHKEGKDPSFCGSYRPISLLNVDLKLFSKIIATRIAQHLESLIHLDQMGFIPTREARDNTIKVLNLVHIAKANNIPSIFISTDAEKAFDRVNWDYMFSVLRHIGLGDRMMKWIGNIYSIPSAQVKVNGILSSPFPIRNGTRQGCPLSPLLFALSLEPFLRKIRSNPDISGLQVGNINCKNSAYADDLLFSLTNPKISLPNLMREFKTYGEISHLKINFSKSEAMGVSVPPTTLAELQSNFSFKWTSTALKYLGTYIPPDTTRTFDLNFPPLLTKTRTLLDKWHTGFHSWFGRCNLLKMSILPKFIYLIQALPIHIPPFFFRQIHALFIRFVWAHKRPRLRRSQMTLPKQFGGLALPDIRLYYMASHLGRILDWRRNGSSKLWIQLEQAQSSVPLGGALWCFRDLPRELKSYPLIGITLRNSHQSTLHTNLTSENSPLFPILGNPKLEPGLGLRLRPYAQKIPHWHTSYHKRIVC